MNGGPVEGGCGCNDVNGLCSGTYGSCIGVDTSVRMHD